MMAKKKLKIYKPGDARPLSGRPIDFYIIEELTGLVNRCPSGARLWARRNKITRYSVAKGVHVFDEAEVIHVLATKSILNEANVSFDIISSALNKTIPVLKKLLQRHRIVSYDDAYANKRYCKRKDLLKGNIIISL